MLKRKIHRLIHDNKFVVNFITTLIVLNVLALILESYHIFEIRYASFFKYFELGSVIIFTIEYLLRFYCANIDGKNRIKYFFSVYGLIDLLAIAPFYIPFAINLDLRVIRILRIFRFIRIFKLGRYNRSFKTIRSVLHDTKEELLMTLFISLIFLLISSTLMYYAESDIQPDKFKSIGHSFWWAIATLTTVGYGDIYPISATGKVLNSVIALIGIGFIALPTGIISSAFIEELRKNSTELCPHCGKDIHEHPRV